MRRSRGWVVVALSQLACASLSPNLQVKEKLLPERFDLARDGGVSSARTPWRDYFEDPRLVALIDEGLRESPDVAMATQRIERTRAAVTLTTGALFPTVGATLSAGLMKPGLFTAEGAGNATTDITPGQTVPAHLPDFKLGLQASWEVDLWGKLRSQRSAAEAQVLGAVEQAHLVRTMLVAAIANTWFELQATDRVHEVLVQTIARQTEALEVVRLQKEGGRASELAVQQFEAQLAETRALEIEAKQEAVALEIALNTLVGRTPRTVERSGALSFEPPAPVSAGLPSDLLLLRPDVRQAELSVQAARFEVAAARAAFFPSLNLSASVGLQAFNPEFLVRLPESLIYSLVGGLVAPLINRTGIEAAFQGATAAQLEAMYDYQKVVLTAFAEATTSLSALEASARLVAVKRQQRAAVERSVETADVLFRAGRATYLEVLLAQQSSLRAELELVAAWRRQRQASVTVYRALGGGWESTAKP